MTPDEKEEREAIVQMMRLVINRAQKPEFPLTALRMMVWDIPKQHATIVQYMENYIREDA
jgi:hypothetical protein